MEKELRKQCHYGIQRVLAQRGWALVQNEETFVEEVLSEVRFRVQNSRLSLEKIIKDATINRYNHIWYAACSGSDRQRQRRAFTELQRYLYSVALYRASHNLYVAEEATQQALIKVWQHLAQVRDPGSFQRWASRIVIREVPTIGEPHEISETDLKHPGEPDIVESPLTKVANEANLTTPPSDSEFIMFEMRTRLADAIARCLRSIQQRLVIIGLFFDQKGYKEVADELRMSVQNTHVLKSRALKRLRECDEFLKVLEESL